MQRVHWEAIGAHLDAHEGRNINADSEGVTIPATSATQTTREQIFGIPVVDPRGASKKHLESAENEYMRISAKYQKKT